MREIFGFIKDNGLYCRMNTDFYAVNFSIRGDEGLAARIPKIMGFINDITCGRIKRD